MSLSVGSDDCSVGVVIPAFNAERFISDAIASVLAQSHAHLECVVIDDGSTDDTAAVAEGFGDRVRVIRQPNRGVSAARNRGVDETTAPFLAFLDADDCWLPRRLELGLAFLRDAAPLQAVVCGTQVVDESRRPLRILRQDAHPTPYDLLLCRATLVSASSNLLITRTCFEAAGRFDDRLSTSADWALSFRLIARGSLGSIPEPLVEYRLHSANMSADIDAFERDMLQAFDDLLAGPDADPNLKPVRRRAYANLHRVISGSYFVARRPRPFCVHAARSIAGHPSTIPYFLGMLGRRRRRRDARP